MSKPLRAGGEVDSWCTKCKLVLNHRIIAMVGPTPKRVECSTCGSHHNFRPRAAGDKAGATTKAAAPSRATGASSPPPRSTRGPTKAQQAVMDRERTWENAVLGKGVNDFRAFRVDQMFGEGELVRHKKFGEGVVLRILEGNKVEILFRDEARTLAHGLKT